MIGARPPRRSSLVGRLVLLAGAWSLAVVITAGLALSAFFSHATLNRFDQELFEVVEGLLAGASVGEAGNVTAPALTDPQAMRVFSGEYWEIAAVSPGGGLHALARSRSLWDEALKPPPPADQVLAKARGKAQFYDSTGPLKQPLRVSVLVGRLPGVAPPLVFMAAEDRAPIDKDIRTFATEIAVALVLLGAGLIAAVIIQVRVGLQPLFALRRQVAAVRTGAAERVAGVWPTELEPLASELNALVAHNQEVVERQRTHVGNLAHALKTPLTVILTEAAQRPGALAEVVARQATTMRDQVDHHLRRARAAARAQGQGERTPVAAVLDELARTLERIFRGKTASIDWRAPEDLAFLGERQDLLEIAGNVIENACKWCRGQVRIAASPLGPRQLSLVIEDDGPGLPPQDREEMVRRGARLDENAPGSGLGLSIVDELVRAYGGEMTLGASPLGGLKVELILPRAGDPSSSVPLSGRIGPKAEGREV